MAEKHKGMTLVIGLGAPRRGGLPPLGTPAERQAHAEDVEAAFTGRPQPHGTYDRAQDEAQVSPGAAGYMELDGAQKTGDCNLVAVPGGVSGERGCCNLFAPPEAEEGPDGVTTASGATEFQCAQCTHYQPESQPGAGRVPKMEGVAGGPPKGAMNAY